MVKIRNPTPIMLRAGNIQFPAESVTEIPDELVRSPEVLQLFAEGRVTVVLPGPGDQTGQDVVERKGAEYGLERFAGSSFWKHPDGTVLSTAEALQWLKRRALRPV